MYLDSNTTKTAILTEDIPMLVENFTTGVVSGWTFAAGSNGVIASISQDTGDADTVWVVDEAHGLSAGDIISIHGSTNYNYVYEVYAVDTDSFKISATWGATDTGTWQEGSHLIAGTGAAGIYAVDWHMSATADAAAEILIRAYINSTKCSKCVGMRKFANNDVGNIVGGAIATIADGDKIFISATNTDGVIDVTFRYGNFSLHRL